MASVSKAVVVGGGLAGLAASLALARAGVKVDVLELAPEPHGAALGISGRAAETLVDLGIYDESYAIGVPFLPDRTAPPSPIPKAACSAEAPADRSGPEPRSASAQTPPSESMALLSQGYQALSQPY